MTNSSSLNSADFLAITTEYDALRRQTVASLLGPTVMAQALEQRDILEGALANLTREELGTYLETQQDEESSDSATAIDQLESAKADFDEDTLHKMNLSPILNTNNLVSFYVTPGRLGIMWVDVSKSIPQEMMNHLVAQLNDEGEVAIKRRAHHKDLPARNGDDLLVKWILDEVASVTDESRKA